MQVFSVRFYPETLAPEMPEDNQPSSEMLPLVHKPYQPYIRECASELLAGMESCAVVLAMQSGKTLNPKP